MKKSRLINIFLSLTLLIFILLIMIFFKQKIENSSSTDEVAFSERNDSSEIMSSFELTSSDEATSSSEVPIPNSYQGPFELPIQNSTGYASIQLEVKETSNVNSKTTASLNAGEGFKILEENADWWRIETDNFKGWILHRYAFINLPDVIPSIIYNNTNSYSSIFRSHEEYLLW
ncbi:SH3 domain-containing protein [Enterococcus olivae]